MKSLLLLDWYTLWKQLKLFLAFILFYAVLSLVIQNAQFLAFSLMFLCVMPFYLLQINEGSRFDVTLLLAPISRRLIVGERYVTVLMSAVLSLPLMLATWLVLGADAALILVFQLSVGLVLIALLLPLAYKFGSTKSRIFMMLLLVLFFVFAGASQSLYENMGAVLSVFGNWFLLFIRFSLPAALVLLLVSYFISVQIYEKRSF